MEEIRLIESEKILHEMKPERRVVVLWLFKNSIFKLAMFGLLFLPIWFSIGKFGGSRAITHDAIQMAFFVLPLFIFSSIYVFKLHATFEYFITDKRCVISGGILRKVERSVPYHKITDVEVSQHIVERILSISSLLIFTPGTASMSGSAFGSGQRAEITFEGLKNAEEPAATINKMLQQFKTTGE